MAVAALAPVVHPKATPEESAPARASCSVRFARASGIRRPHLACPVFSCFAYLHGVDALLRRRHGGRLHGGARHAAE